METTTYDLTPGQFMKLLNRTAAPLTLHITTGMGDRFEVTLSPGQSLRFRSAGASIIDIPEAQGDYSGLSLVDDDGSA